MSAQCHGRLSLISGYPTTESNIVGAVNIYYVPASGASVAIFDGTDISPFQIGSQLSLPLDNNSSHAGYHQAGKIFDLFAICVLGVPTLGTGPAWASDTSRGTGAATTEIALLSWLNVNKNAINVRIGTSSGDIVSVPPQQATYLGSFRATAVGQASNSNTQRLLFNAYNSMAMPLSVEGGVAAYVYSGATWQSLANVGLKAEFLLGLSGGAVQATATAFVLNSTATGRIVRAGIGLDSFTAPADHALTPGLSVTNALAQLVAHYDGYPGIGYHFLAPIEMGAGADVQTWFPYGPGYYRGGLKGRVIG